MKTLTTPSGRPSTVKTVLWSLVRAGITGLAQDYQSRSVYGIPGLRIKVSSQGPLTEHKRVSLYTQLHMLNGPDRDCATAIVRTATVQAPSLGRTLVIEDAPVLIRLGDFAEILAGYQQWLQQKGGTT